MAKKLLIAFAALVVTGAILSVVFTRTGTMYEYERSAEIEGVKGCPPVPNFFDPVDYVAWLDQQLGANKPDSFAQTYDGFWRHSSSTDDEGMPDPAKDVRKKLRALTMAPVWQAGDHPDVEAYLASVAEYLDIFKAGAKKPGYRLRLTPDPKDPRDPTQLTLPWTLSSKYAAHSLLALSWREGPNQVSRMLDAWRTCLRHAAHLQSTNQLLLCRSGTQIRLAVYDCMRAAVARGILGGEAYGETLRVLAEADPGDVNLPEVIRYEWAGTLGFVQTLYPKGRLNRELVERVGYIGGKNSPQFVQPDQVRASGISPAQLIKAADEHYVKLLRLAKQPLTTEWLAMLTALGVMNANGKLAGHPLRPSIQPTLRLFFREQLRGVTAYRATRLVLMLLDHRTSHGAWPESLSQVCNDVILRTDPCSGREFVYRRTSPSETESKVVFVLHSVGEDGEDNDGTHGPWGDLFGPIDEGRDFVFWPFQRGPN